MSWTAHEALAEAAAVALTEDGALEGITPPLTAPRTLDFADVAEILGRLTGRTVTRVVLDDHEWMSAAVADGMPRPAAAFALTMCAASREGESDVIGRPAKTVHEALEAAVRSLRSSR